MTRSAHRALFFEALHRHGFRDLRAISTDKRIVRASGFPSEDLYKAEDYIALPEHQGLNIYVGVAERIHRHGRQLKDCSALRALFIDIDFKAMTSEKAME